MAAHGAPGAVTSGAERQLHALGRPCQDIGRSPHRPADKNRLADGSQCLRNGGVTGTEDTAWRLCDGQMAFRLAVWSVLFNFAGVVRHVVEERQFHFGKTSLKACLTRWVMICRLARAQLIAALIAPK